LRQHRQFRLRRCERHAALQPAGEILTTGGRIRQRVPLGFASAEQRQGREGEPRARRGIEWIVHGAGASDADDHERHVVDRDGLPENVHPPAVSRSPDVIRQHDHRARGIEVVVAALKAAAVLNREPEHREVVVRRDAHRRIRAYRLKVERDPLVAHGDQIHGRRVFAQIAGFHGGPTAEGDRVAAARGERAGDA
jgi:hypothetical protein